MAQLSEYDFPLSYQEVISLISTVGKDTTIVVRGSPGIGKTALLNSLAAIYPTHDIAKIDVGLLDVGELAFPVVNKEEMITEYAINSRFKIKKNQTKPIIVLLDELGKATSTFVQNAIMPIILEHRIGDVYLPEGSIVFGTSNLDGDGVGDFFQAHHYDRFIEVILKNTSPAQWMLWAKDNNIAPELLAFVEQFPMVFDSYLDLSSNQSNPYIFNPKLGNTKKFVSPRALELISPVIKNRLILGNTVTKAALVGRVGIQAAQDIMAICDKTDKLPKINDVLAQPLLSQLPNDEDLFIMIFILYASLTSKNVYDIITYMNRIQHEEAHVMLFRLIESNKKLCSRLSANKQFRDYQSKFKDLFKPIPEESLNYVS